MPSDQRPDTSPRHPSEILRSIFRVTRLIAVLSFGVAALVLLSTGKDLLDQDLSAFVSTTKISTTGTALEPGGAAIQPETRQGTVQNLRSQDVRSTAPMVWAFALQLIAWIGVEGLLFWAVVVLCREE